MERAIATMGYSLRVADSLEEADQVQRKKPFEALLLQTDAPNGHDGGRWGDGLPFGAGPPVIAVGRERSIRDAVHSIRAGASDYVSVFPLDGPSLRSALAHALSSVEEAPGAARMTPLPEEAPEEFFTADERTRALWRLVLSAADSRMPFLIEGESGSGKSFLARKAHDCSWRRFGPFVEANCGLPAEALLESELFGQARGTPESKWPERAGKFELADRGTILLDEIENASPALQARLLGMLESGEFQRVGDTRMIQSDARLIAAANTPLEEAVARGRFREDLYRRVSTLKLRLLPLRERVADIPLLARQFLQHFALLHGRRVRGISSNALECLVHYPWPGNVRELRHVIEHAVVLARGEMLMTEHLPPWVLCAKPFPVEAQPRRAPRPLREAMHEPERQWIMRALNVSGWNKRNAASELGISRSTLYKKMKKFDLDQLEPRGISSAAPVRDLAGSKQRFNLDKWT
ncbi:MAG: sigma 54-interacting transcriptional regulator [Candidatus Brocadiia bacterium]